MKKIIFALLLGLPTLTMAEGITPSDTTIYVKGKKIVIKEDNEKIKVKLYEQTSKGDTIENTQLFEGIYRDGRSSERRMSTGINIPIPRLSSKYTDSNRVRDPHWAGLGYGFSNFSDSKLNINDVNGVDVVSSKSREITINLYEKAWSISKNGFAIVSGFGFRFNKYRIDGNSAFKEIDGITQIESAAKGTYYQSSKLYTNYLTIPLLLEYQKRLHRTGPLFISAGVVANVKFYSASKIEYEASGNKQKEKLGSDLNIRPISMDFLVQGGVGCFGMYAKYSPFSLFEKGKGPNIHPVSIGLILHFSSH